MLWLLGVVLSTLSVLGAPSEGGKGQIWAVLVAGSNGFMNYRHQADVCHAYQIFHRHGIPDSNIIVMMYDDIANNPENPDKGQIFNKPGGPNVYGPKEVPKDYTKKEVTPENFIHVLTGNSAAVERVGSGKVLNSGPDDHVFIYFTDHGSAGMVVFPKAYLYADVLNKALKTMHDKKMYKKLVFYMDACESGSMFNNILPNNISVFATTAANPDEGSAACYWDDKIQTFLGDTYSVAWLEDVDSEEHQKNMTTETLHTQFQNVLKRVKYSHPSKYGNTNIQTDRVMKYIGESKDTEVQRMDVTPIGPFQDSVSARDVLLHTLKKRLELSNSEEGREMLQNQIDTLIAGRKQVDDLFSRILSYVTNNNGEDIQAIEREHQPLNLEMMPCYRTLVDTFHRKCININMNTYVLGHLYKFANLCVTKDT